MGIAPSTGTADREVVDDHRGRVDRDAGRLHQPVRGRRRGRRRTRNWSTCWRSADTSADSSAVRAGRLAHPERDGGRGVAGVADAHHAGLDAADLPRVRAEQEDVAGHRLDGPVLVDGADERVVGLGDHAVVAGLGDRAARRERGEPGALAPAQLAVDGVVVHVRATRAATGLRCRRRRDRPLRRTARGSRSA